MDVAIMKLSVGVVWCAMASVISHTALADSTGSGFVVNPAGYIVTNNHVVTVETEAADGEVYWQECASLDVKGDPYGGAGKVVGRDWVNDLALVKVETPALAGSLTGEPESVASDGGTWKNLADDLAAPTGGDQPPEKPATETADFVRFAATPAKQGESISLFGFPLGEYVSEQMKVTTGIVVATVGGGNNSSQFQFDAAVNPGNSGGPVLDGSGNLVGVAASNLRGAEGFNFAIKTLIVASFMDAQGIAYFVSQSDQAIATDRLYQRARNFVVLITCN